MSTVAGIVFARGGAVAILIELHCEGSIYALLIRQPRLPIGFAQFPEIVAGQSSRASSPGLHDVCFFLAGMLDGSGNFAGMAAKELEEGRISTFFPPTSLPSRLHPLPG